MLGKMLAFVGTPGKSAVREPNKKPIITKKLNFGCFSNSLLIMLEKHKTPANRLMKNGAKRAISKLLTAFIKGS